MEMHISVLTILLKYVNNKYRRDNNYHIARGLIACYDEIPSMTIYEVADKCFVSTAAISRFIKHIGFDSYTVFKQACEEKIDIINDYSKQALKLEPEEFPTFVNNFTANIQNNLVKFNEEIDFEELAKVTELIHDAEDVAVFGLEFASFLAQHFQIKLAEMNKEVKIGTTLAEQAEVAKNMKPSGVALIFSLEGGYFYYNDKVLQILKDKDVTLIVFTMKKVSKIEKIADKIITCGVSNEDTEGRLSILYLMELLIYQYLINYYR